MKEQWRTVGYLKEHLAVDQPRLRVGPALYGAKRTVAAQKCGLLSERDWSVSLFLSLLEVFLQFFWFAFYFFCSKYAFLASLFMRNENELFRRKQSDEERKEKKGLSGKLN